MNTPILAPNCSWFIQGGTVVKRADITEITEEEYMAETVITFENK